MKLATSNSVMALVTAMAISPAAIADLSWSFDTDASGWGTLNDARNFEWDGTIGQPAGAIRARDNVSGQIWYFSAPTAELSEAAGSYGGSISWDALGIQGNQTSIPGSADVMLFGAGLQIGVSLGVVPLTTAWTSWNVNLDDASGWRIVSSESAGQLSNVAVTGAQLEAVLNDLQGFHIRGEFTSGADQSAIDNVLLVPTPAALPFIGLVFFGARRRRA